MSEPVATDSVDASHATQRPFRRGPSHHDHSVAPTPSGARGTGRRRMHKKPRENDGGRNEHTEAARSGGGPSAGVGEQTAHAPSGSGNRPSHHDRSATQTDLSGSRSSGRRRMPKKPRGDNGSGHEHTDVASSGGGPSVSGGERTAHTPSGPGSRHSGQRTRVPRQQAPQDTYSTNSTIPSAPPTPSQTNAALPAGGTPASGPPPKPQQTRRRGQFNASLTEPSSTVPDSADKPPSGRYRRAVPTGDDLTSRLTRELSTPPYPDCLICFAPIHPMQPTWSCSPSILISDVVGGDGAQDTAETAQCCWTTFHLKCIRAWAGKSVKDLVEAWRARGEEREGEWRCPGCQSKRTTVPSVYWCFCGSTPDPKPPRLATPHSCANACTRKRACGHACLLTCHPGPCLPCQVTTQLPCHCGKQTLSFRCAHLSPSKTDNRTAAELSCGTSCGHSLACGNHKCQEPCHPGPCPPCKVRETVRCYCGKTERDVPCGFGEEKQCTIIEDGRENRWAGRFECESTCDRPFDCGVHRCSKPCHPPSPTPVPCPRSPSLVTHCPCGKHALTTSSAPHFPSRTRLVRTSCTDPIPTCESTCMKPLAGCAHACAALCHTGPCPPCKIMLVRPCRCGATTHDVSCAEEQARAQGTSGAEEILCERPCGALRACGRHQCTRLCCPLAALAGAAKGKGKKKAAGREGAIVDEAGWHECDLVCGRMLACGNHRCALRDHKGACPSCLRSSFEEMVCHCGRTVLEPPIPCGTRINCPYPCARPPPPCGHPKANHACHEDPAPCPPCSFLATKQCACGKKMIDNVKCSQERVYCGTPCGKLLSCGFHHCERVCHSDDCGPCNAVCGKPRKLCLPSHHPCTLPCHAPASCDETEPCRTTITLLCPCGRIRQNVPCGRSTSNPAGREGSQQLKCSNECLVAKRNARLAEALGINPSRVSADKQATYSDELQSAARANPKFCAMVEKSLADFFASDRKIQTLAPMPEARRKFVHDLAVVYRMDTQMVDQEPYRSVQLIRRIDSCIPSPLLSAVAAAPPPSSSPSLGKLADLRSPGLQALARPRTPQTFPNAGSSAAGGWRAVAARPPQAGPTLNAWGAPQRASPTPRPLSSSSSRVVQSTSGTSTPVSADVPDNWEDDV
ncbi:hypothetical protein WOLCODRAFT_105893 [Wolfiporia cocos MD-104 SS10]|uniref:R3H domain-containing protein n=1 Tax=Wolfiporia cocos (strain MD-104) TaxID=742152 RepID=A0A2H3K428_WOLCO|nr:hypothetical protein WOLCODRAFT_105893 [Wolfiporia cocos MD-104 SS10]